MLDRILEWLVGLPPLLTYVVVGLGAAIENIVPPIPADTFVLFGGFLAAQGEARTWAIFFVTWGCNVAGALAVWFVASRHADLIKGSRFGRYLLDPEQMRRLERFYGRWHTPAIFFSRFLPAFRAVVPAFAGVSGVGFFAVLLPLASASALWYGGLVYLGSTAGRNWEQIRGWLDNVNLGLLVVALALAAAVGWWWWRTRHRGGA